MREIFDTVVGFLQDGYNSLIAILPSGIIGNIIHWVTLILVLIIFLIPTIIAVKNKHRKVFWVFVVNLVFGWTLIGWIIALIWALNRR